MNDAAQVKIMKYMALKTEAMMMYGHIFPVDIYLNLSEKKYLKISHKHEDAHAIIEKYKNRGVEYMYVDQEDFHQFTAAVREHLLKKIEEQKANEKSDENAALKQKAQYLSGARDVLKSIYDSGSVDAESKKLAKAISQQTVAIIGRSTIFEKFSEFKKHCSEEYLHATVTSYVASLMIDQFSWGNDAIKEKCALAILLSDILLSPEEFQEMKAAKGDPSNLSFKVKDHPNETAKMLAEDSKFVPAETLKIIEQHHESPNGKGYPNGTNYQGITVLTCICIVANYFVERMFDENYKEEFANDRAESLVSQVANKFVNGNFRKASEALATVYEEQGALKPVNT